MSTLENCQRPMLNKLVIFYQYDYDAMAENLMIDGNQLIINKLAKSKNFNIDFAIDQQSDYKNNEIMNRRVKLKQTLAKISKQKILNNTAKIHAIRKKIK